ncbi:hypothetical protein ABH912_000477 [Pseudomonas sp. BT76 TE3572]|uniref:trypsin-like serine protease n=1 Tax=Pseudomonas sp. BT76 TE3572 TaxID=3349325 RepID=UPI003D21E748
MKGASVIGRVLVGGLLLAPLHIGSISVAAPTSSGAEGETTITFELANAVLNESSIQVANGVEVFASDWPALIIASFEEQTIFGKRQGSCTASLVGPNVALMAAHCVDPKGGDLNDVTPLTPSLRVGDRVIPFRCEMHPDYSNRPRMAYSPRGSEDFALCVLEDNGNRPQILKTMQFEVVDDQSKLAPGTRVLLTGYGCESLRIVDGRPQGTKADGKLRLGNVEIDKGPASIPGAPAYVTIRSKSNVEPALCPGDSGGPLLSGITAEHANKPRRIRGVNSSISVTGDVFISSIAATGTTIFRNWADRWLVKNAKFKPEICGLNVRAGERQCRY